ncbi:PIN-like domain-containing protein [Flavobacterium flavigenum]|uniref:PIN-like domain-containing protein n=1 Tax=Flavobacterium flavigenum TaxID=3003258 RepID=UPI00248255AF|nr:PIN-like domain-containing protein [Flavobacterium flavigenum]
MKFPKSLLDKDEYLKRINDLLIDNDSIIFIDTNILALFFKMNISARMEFYAWIDKMIEKNKIKVPTWVINEYTNRFIRKKTSDYLDGGSKLSTIQKEFASLANYLKLHVDDKRLNKTKYANTGDLFTDLDSTQECLKKIHTIVATKMTDYIIEAHDELVSRFEAVNINSDIFDLVAELVPDGKSRYLQELPPGFEDDKDFNSFGDLIIWNEILNYSSNNEIKKVIIITNDNKKDWMYAPLRIVENGRTKSNSQPEFKIADPRLVYEFQTYTDSEELYIINFETLTKLLISDDNNSKYFKLAKALQLIHDLDDEANNELNTDVISEENTSNEITTPSDVVVDVPGVIVKNDEYSEFAIADSTSIDLNSELISVITMLKSHNWYAQNEAIEIINSLNFESFENNQINKDLFFIIGRNIYQSACGGAFQAVEFIESINQKLEKITIFNVDLLNGILFEIYFNSIGEIRNKYKNTFYQKIFELSEIDAFDNSFNFINQHLEKTGNAIFIIPVKNSPIRNISVNISDKDGRTVRVESVTLDGFELLEEEAFSSISKLGNVRGFENFVLNKYALPLQLVKFDYSQNPGDKFFVLEEMDFKNNK